MANSMNADVCLHEHGVEQAWNVISVRIFTIIVNIFTFIMLPFMMKLVIFQTNINLPFKSITTSLLLTICFNVIFMLVWKIKLIIISIQSIGCVHLSLISCTADNVILDTLFLIVSTSTCFVAIERAIAAVIYQRFWKCAEYALSAALVLGPWLAAVISRLSAQFYNAAGGPGNGSIAGLYCFHSVPQPNLFITTTSISLYVYIISTTFCVFMMMLFQRWHWKKLKNIGIAPVQLMRKKNFAENTKTMGTFGFMSIVGVITSGIAFLLIKAVDFDCYVWNTECCHCLASVNEMVIICILYPYLSTIDKPFAPFEWLFLRCWSRKKFATKTSKTVNTGFTSKVSVIALPPIKKSNIDRSQIMTAPSPVYIPAYLTLTSNERHISTAGDEYNKHFRDIWACE